VECREEYGVVFGVGFVSLDSSRTELDLEFEGIFGGECFVFLQPGL
jgi:hypothetical protein